VRKLARILSGLSVLHLFAALMLVGCGPGAPPFECTDAIGCVEVAADDPIKIGVMQVLSGDLQIFGQSGLRSIDLTTGAKNSSVIPS
jgi:ABC-type branched-subunit amino acid transport system substrate-binding protein